MNKFFILSIFALLITSIPLASAVQLEATILHNKQTTEPEFQFLRILYIDYPNGGELASNLQSVKQKVTFHGDTNIAGVNDLKKQLNDDLKAQKSSVIITDLKLEYQAILEGYEEYAVIEYKIKLTPTITNYIISKNGDKSTIDASWRGMSVTEPVFIQTEYGLFDINNPKAALDSMMPDVSEKLNDIDLIELPLLDASGTMDLPLYKWHSLFDNTAIIPGAVEYKFSGENVVTNYSMGECNIEIGLCDDRLHSIDFTLDEDYTVRSIESRDDATIKIEGYVDTTRFGANEVFLTDLKNSVSLKPDTGDFPTHVILGMAAIAAIAGVGFFIFSNRSMKNQSTVQTGIDPKHLVAYQTSSSSGGYQTNRGESYLKSIDDSKSTAI
jgi:hypothetical protein